jgi:hypothetical protein
MSVRHGRIRRFHHLASVLALFAASAQCGTTPDDRFYASATADGRLLAVEVGDTITVTAVGAMGTPGCASLALSADGTLYSVCGTGIINPHEPQQLATIDRATGKATLFGTAVTGLQVMGLEFAPDGMLYAVGDANGASPTFNSLYTVDVKSGEFTRVGSTGVPAPEFFMDFAFDRDGTMFGATAHALFTIDRVSGTATKVTDFVGGGEIMGLSYNLAQDTLYATDWKAPNSALYAVNTRTGILTPLAATGHPLAHGLVAMAP